MAPRDCAGQLATLERLLAVPTANLELALVHACNEIVQPLGADKADAFLYDAKRDTLVAVGSSTQPLSALEKRHGLDQLALANGGRAVEVYLTGKSFMHGRVDEDDEELRGIRDVLRIRSTIGVPLEVAGKRKGVLLLASLQHDFWTDQDVRFAEATAVWVGRLAHHAELVEEIERNAAERGRLAAAEDLVTTLAHDLRNLLNPVDVRLQLIQRRALAEGRDVDVADVEKARKSVDRLSSLISDILDVTRIEHGSLSIELQPVDLTTLLREVVATLSTPQQPIYFVASEEIVVIADGARIRQSVENMLGNALKHSPASASVTLSLGRTLHGEAECATIDVIDEGPGVPPSLLPHIFERFVTGKKGGLGIGLFLAKRIALLHGGDLKVDTEREKGARFTLTLPMG